MFGVLGIFLVFMMSGVLGATGDGFEAGKNAVSFFGGFLNAIFAQFFGETEMLSRFFFAILLGMIIYSVIGSIFSKSNQWVKTGISIAITSLALLGLPPNFLEAIRVQYGAMGATILTVIPFMIILVFSLKVKNLLFTRVTWLFYAGYYFAMYTYEIANAGGLLNSPKAIPYMAAWVVGLFLFFGIGAIRNLLFKGEIEGIVESGMQTVEKRKVARMIDDANLTAQTGVTIKNK
jgi:hypothetical protein